MKMKGDVKGRAQIVARSNKKRYAECGRGISRVREKRVGCGPPGPSVLPNRTGYMTVNTFDEIVLPAG